jgi:Protein of unknown function (DUF3800)
MQNRVENSASEFIAYIDESGDEGLGKLRVEGPTGQSKWLALGAAVVSLENDRSMPAWRNEVLDLFPFKRRQDLHFRNLNHDQAVATCHHLATKPIGICVVASNKITLLDSEKLDVFKKPQHLYNYLVRFLLERVTTSVVKALKRGNLDKGRLHLVFSRRSNTDYKSMKEYLELMRDGKELFRPVRSVLWDVLDLNDLRVQNHANRAGLQIADVVTSATTRALEPNIYGYCESRYALSLKQRYIKHDGKIENCGLTIIPPRNKNPLTEEQKIFLDELEKR